MTTSTPTITGHDVATIERDLRRMELLNRREHMIRATGRAVPAVPSLELATRLRERWRNPDA
jgi:hypothetical protein